MNLVAHALRGEGFDASEDGTGRGTPIVAAHGFMWMSGVGDVGTPDMCPTLVRSQTPAAAITPPLIVRRLTPVECERLQGFPDDYTAITVRGKPAADGPRYKALGNSWAVPCARWIGKRIEMVEAVAPAREAA